MNSLRRASLWLSRGALLLDIRTKEEYNRYHLCKAHNIPTALPPLSKIQKDLLGRRLKLFLFKNQVLPNTPLIVYCKKGIRAAEARKQLLNLGAKYVLNLGGVEEEPLKSIITGERRIPFLTFCSGSNKNPSGK